MRVILSKIFYQSLVRLRLDEKQWEVFFMKVLKLKTRPEAVELLTTIDGILPDKDHSRQGGGLLRKVV